MQLLENFSNLKENAKPAKWRLGTKTEAKTKNKDKKKVGIYNFLNSRLGVLRLFK